MFAHNSLDGCGMSTFASRPTPMHVRDLKSAEISQVGFMRWLAGSFPNIQQMIGSPVKTGVLTKLVIQLDPGLPRISR